LLTASYVVDKIDKTQRVRQSLPPFTTSLLQQAAATSFGFSVKQTMSLAQRLYEEGLITYHRTDSFNLSSSAIEKAREYILTNFGQSYLPEKARVFAKSPKMLKRLTKLFVSVIFPLTKTISPTALEH
jgi:DNA topoisomerase-1